MAIKKVGSKEIAEALSSAKSIALFGHILPDGDCYGSVFALKIAMEGLGKDVFSYIADDMPEYLSFLKDYENIKMQESFVSVDLVLVLDCSDVKRAENHDFLYKYQQAGTQICLIDHHMAGDLVEFADMSWQDPAKSSTSEMVLDILKDMNVRFKKDIATLLLTGIETDTSSFQNQNTTAEVFDAAAFLTAKGARLPQIVNNTFHAKDMDTIKLYGLVLERLIYNKKYGTVTGYLTREDARQLGIEGDLSTGVANYLNTIEDVKMVVFITEVEEGKLKVSLRTRNENVDVQKLASQVGGGGHVKASGFTVQGKVVNEDGKIKITC